MDFKTMNKLPLSETAGRHAICLTKRNAIWRKRGKARGKDVPQDEEEVNRVSKRV